MKHVIATLLTFLASGSVLAEPLPKFSCSIQQISGVSGETKRTTFRTEDFNDLTHSQRIMSTVPEFSTQVPTPQLDVYADIVAVDQNSRVRVYSQITHKNQNVMIGSGVGYFDIHSRTMEIEVDSMQGTNYGAIVYCEKK
jgi:hypothetical protein